MTGNSGEGNTGDRSEDLVPAELLPSCGTVSPGLVQGELVVVAGASCDEGEVINRPLPIPSESGVAVGPCGVGDSSLQLTAEQVRAALRETEGFLMLLLENMAGAGVRREELSRPEDRQSVAHIAAMAEEIRRGAIDALPELPFRKSPQVMPSPAAYTIMVQAREKAQLEMKKKDKLAADSARMLTTIFSFGVGIDVTQSSVVEKIEAFVAKHASKDGLEMNMVINSFFDRDSEFCIGVDKNVIENAFKDKRAVDLINDPKVSIFRSGVLPSKHFEQLLAGKVAALVMDISKTWQARCAEKNDGEVLTTLISKARGYIQTTFNKAFLGPELSSCNSLEELQKYARLLPVDEASFDLLKKSHLFLKVMHIMLLHESEVDSLSFVDNSNNLREELRDFCMPLFNKGCCYFNPPRDENCDPMPDFEEDIYGMEVDRVEVADGKPVNSTIDKIFRKDLYDTTEIGDFARMRIFLKKEDCYNEDGSYNEEKAEKAAEKVLGIMMARFGDDIDLKSLDYSFSTGKTNEASKGAHRGLHFNFKYKSSSYKNGITPANGEPDTKSIDVEAQILAYMPKDEYEADHDEYEKSRRALLFKKMGAENGFDNFAMDLISAVSNDKYDFDFRSLVDPFDDIRDIDEEIRNLYERQFGFGDENLFPEDVDMDSLMEEGWILFSKDKLRLFILLLTILTKQDNSGKFANGKFIDYMQRYFPGKLHGLMDKYSKILRGDEFKEGGEYNYLKRMLEAKMHFVRGAISTGKPLSAWRDSNRVFEVSHSFKVGNVGKRNARVRGKKSKGQNQNNPKLTLVTHFTGDGTRSGHTMELPYNGPIGLVGIPREGGQIIDFCWQLQNGKQSAPVYRIECNEKREAVDCYLLAGGQKLQIWELKVNYEDETGFHGKMCSCSYKIQNDPVTNKASIVAKADNYGNDIAVRSLERLNPAMGMDQKQGRFIGFVQEAGKIWNRAKSGQITTGEYTAHV